MHSAGIEPPLARVDRRLAARLSAFASLRFDGIVPHEAALVAAGMEQRGASLEIINMVGGGDIDRAVIDGIEHCGTFIVFGTLKYGEDTGNNACTYYESKFAKDRNKRIILIRMIPFDADFEFPQARFMFGLNKLVIPWMLGTPMPGDLVDKVLEAMEISGGAQPEPQPEPLAPAPAPAAPAGAWPVELSELVSIPSFVACLAGLEVNSLADFAESIDVDEGHDKQMQAVLDALPDKPRKKKLLRNRAQRQLADLLQRLALFIEYDSNEEGSLNRVDCLRIPAEEMQARSGGSVGERFDDIDADRDGLISFTELFEHTEVTPGEGLPPADAGPPESDVAAEQERAKAAEAQAMAAKAADDARALDAQRAQMEEQAVALRRQQSALDKRAAAVDAERAYAERLASKAHSDTAAAEAALRLAMEPEPEPELSGEQAEKDANVLGRSDQPLPDGTRIAVQGYGRGTYVSCAVKLVGANNHTVALDNGSIVTLQLKVVRWTVFAEEMGWLPALPIQVVGTLTGGFCVGVAIFSTIDYSSANGKVSVGDRGTVIGPHATKPDTMMRVCYDGYVDIGVTMGQVNVEGETLPGEYTRGNPVVSTIDYSSANGKVSIGDPGTVIGPHATNPSMMRVRYDGCANLEVDMSMVADGHIYPGGYSRGDAVISTIDYSGANGKVSIGDPGTVIGPHATNPSMMLVRYDGYANLGVTMRQVNVEGEKFPMEYSRGNPVVSTIDYSSANGTVSIGDRGTVIEPHATKPDTMMRVRYAGYLNLGVDMSMIADGHIYPGGYSRGDAVISTIDYSGANGKVSIGDRGTVIDPHGKKPDTMMLVRYAGYLSLGVKMEQVRTGD